MKGSMRYEGPSGRGNAQRQETVFTKNHKQFGSRQSARKKARGEGQGQAL